MAPRIITLLVFSIAISGCISTHSTTTLARQTEVVIWVEKSGTKAKATPNKAILVDETQKVVWYSCEGDVEIIFDNQTLPNPPCLRQGNKRCEMNAPPPGKKGDHKYTVILKISGEPPVKEDPVIIVDY